MTSPTVYQDETYLKDDQYQTSNNLKARADLHRRFSTSPHKWMPWVFEHLLLQPGDHILECGCGPAWLWRENLQRIPVNCHITLTDLSPGMVAEAEAALKESGPAFIFQTANIQSLPFTDDSFDVIVANHMLYHVPDLDQALQEVRRVLRPNGRFYAATNGREHMQEITDLGQKLFPNLQSATVGSRLHPAQLAFRLENGQELLTPHFDKITLVPFVDSLAVTDAQLLLDYILSSSFAQQALNNQQRDQILNHINQEITTKGTFHINKATGLFIAS